MSDAVERQFNPEKLAEQAQRLARSQVYSTETGVARPVYRIIDESYRFLLQAYEALAAASAANQELSPAADWFLDNFYVIREQIREVREGLPRKYYDELPKLKTGPYEGLPRVYEMMHTLVTLTDNVVNEQIISHFVSSFQETKLLSLGELWALPIMLRLVLIQRLSSLSIQILESRESRRQAVEWSRRIAEVADEDPTEVIFVLAEMAEHQTPLSGEFAVTLSEQLHAYGPSTLTALDWIEDRLASRKDSLEKLIRLHTYRETQRQVTVANAITSLRSISQIRWPRVVEELSAVEQTLRQDPAGVYPRMGFKTRDRYRHVIEHLAKFSPTNEFGIAERVLFMASHRSDTAPDDPRVAHVGYYLVDKGRHALEEEVEYNPPSQMRLYRFCTTHSALCYLAPVLAITALLVAGMTYSIFAAGAPVWVVVVAAIASLFPFLDLSVALTNFTLNNLLEPRLLSKMDFSEGIPEDCSTFVVVPCLISSSGEAEELVSRLEMHALSNPDRSLSFALLTDWPDAPEKNVPGDQVTLETARHAVAELNARHTQGDGDRFFLLHRERQWNEKEDVWMGWERKRGKLEEFNRLLRNPDAETSFVTFEGDFRGQVSKHRVRYVITLDADTQLPPDSARSLIQTAAHPLNQPQFDERLGRVVKGYGILQPRVSISGRGGRRTLFARIFSGNVGVDPYTTAVSDVYQDLTGEGIYTGKGLYDVDAFSDALEGTVPDNTVLSHDLLEGNYARCGLVTDIELFDEYPSQYATYAMRLHRWVRGDWQIADWLFPRVRDAQNRRRKNPINTMGRWKIFDNLRRSLTAPSLLLFLLLGWAVFPGSPILWTAVALVILAFPIYAHMAGAVMGHPRNERLTDYLLSVLDDVKITTMQTFLSVAFLAHQGMLMLDAIFKTIWRKLTRRHLLQWIPANMAERLAGRTAAAYVRSMFATIIWAAIVIATLAIFAPPLAFVAASPFVVIWIAAPWIAWAISKPAARKETALTDDERVYLRIVGRKTWRYFDDFIGPENRWLAPDNYQENPFKGIAPRTSPTNMGLSLLALQYGYDNGYITRGDLLHRLGESLGSLRLLDRYRGHFYNWYNTKTGDVLHPAYISSVDSGNLVGALITLRSALAELMTATWPNPATFDGLKDTVWVLNDLLNAPVREDNQPPHARQAAVQKAIDSFIEALPAAGPDDLQSHYAALLRLAPPAAAVTNALRGQTAQPEEGDHGDLDYWAVRLARQIQDHLSEIETLAPWVKTGSAPPGESPDISTIAKLHRHLLDYGDESEELRQARASVHEMLERARRLAEWSQQFIEETEFGFLYDNDREAFRIGYNADTGQYDAGAYDLLASEARLTSYLAIAKDDVPTRHWFALGRPLTTSDGESVLLSWSGTMFEYLMPLLFMRRYENTLLAETYVNVVAWQRRQGERFDLPWGISESAYYHLDLELNYQYRAFGAHGLGLKRGLSQDYVVSPYSSMLALQVDPRAAIENLRALQHEGAMGRLGFYEAVDYTKDRLQPDQDRVVVKTYMVHHQAKSLLAIQNLLQNNRVQERFHADPRIFAYELLLEERIPRKTNPIDPHPIEIDISPSERLSEPTAVDHFPFDRLNDATPYGHLLSNGAYTTLFTNAGTGYSIRNGVALTRWQPDRTTDGDGYFLYLRDVDSGRFWSAGHQPVPNVPPPDRYDVWFHLNKIEMARVDDWIETFMEVCVSPEEDVELRRYTITNYSDRARTIELTSYAEVVLQEQKADAAHPAFSKLFVQTEYLPERDGLLATRRPRSDSDQRQWLFHYAVVDETSIDVEGGEYETDRARFIGRGRTLAYPEAMTPGAKLSGSTGSVLDPVLSLRRTLRLPPKGKVRMTFVMGIADSRSEASRIIYQYDTPYAIQRSFELAAVFGRIELNHLNVSSHRAQFFHRLASGILFGDPALRPKPEILIRNRRQQSNLWAYGISGDNPICVYRAAGPEDLKNIRLLLKAHEYWRMKNLPIELVILNEHPPSYAMELQDQIMQAVLTSTSRGMVNEPGGVFVRRTDQMTEEDVNLILAVARTVLQKGLPNFRLFIERGSRRRLQKRKELSETTPGGPKQSRRTLLQRTERWMGFRKTAQSRDPSDDDGRPDGGVEHVPGAVFREEDLLQFNGYGGFTKDGSEYVIRLAGPDLDEPFRTPMPWTNVIANEQFGFIATESGGSCIWSRNSRENKLTPWSNDPIRDPNPSPVYIRDEDSGALWTPTIGPIPEDARYEIRHGFGYTKYRADSHGLRQEMVQFVPQADTVQITRLRLVNTTDEPRQLSVTRYVEWLLGSLRRHSAHFVIQRYDEFTGAIFAQNWYNNEFSGRVAFAVPVVQGQHEIHYTGDRTSFLGRNGSIAAPDALKDTSTLDDVVPPAGSDPCAAFQVMVTVPPGEAAVVSFLVGEARDASEATKVISFYRDGSSIDEAFDGVRSFWRDLLGVIRVETPSESLNCVMNGWLMYQNVSCRMWGRTAFFQSGGAYGYRDQLQDSMSLVYRRPDLTRSQIILHAAHQFVEGDVLHWWHPPTGRGIRTLFSDDLLWLPFVTLFYCRSTGDWALLDEEAPYITARLLSEGEDEVYLVPNDSGERGTIYDHCCRALDRSLTKGPHGLPLMGSGDWNDGMNRIGIHGKGESVWLGFFLYDILKRFIPVARQRDDMRRMRRYQRYAGELAKALNEAGWDGEWYRRAYFDDGTPVGSSTQEECKIDAIAQAWSVISRVAPPDRAAMALDAVDKHLVEEDAKLIRLLTPPFDKMEHDPGYIKGYVPGVRENGGQYTHGVLWVISANARLGRGTRAAELLELVLPNNHALTAKDADIYKVEPYVVAADVYGEPPHVGRGGWTWYTGSGSWLYRIALEYVLGFRIMEGKRIVLKPCISAEWPGFRISYRYGTAGTVYHIQVENPDRQECGVASAVMDGENLTIKNGEARIPLRDDGKEHSIQIQIGVDATVDA